MSGALFLAGGGTPDQSFALDQLFIRFCSSSRPLVYIPTALRSQAPEACLNWFRSAMEPHGAPTIEMWHDLKPTLPAGQIGGLYIGGGDTVFLLQEMLQTGFDGYIRSVLAGGAPVYGGSAGAIVLGERLGGSKSATEAGHAMTRGLGLVLGHIIACHFEDSDIDRLRALSVSSDAPVIAISEAAGIVIEARGLRNLGSATVTVLDGPQTSSVGAGGVVRLRQTR